MWNWNELKEKAQEAMKYVSEKADEVAGNVAEKATEWTGREISKEHVKKAALAAGVVACMGVALEGMAAPGIESSALAETGGSGGYDGFDDSFEGQSYKFFADKGGLNINTQYLDQDHCQLY